MIGSYTVDMSKSNLYYVPLSYTVMLIYHLLSTFLIIKIGRYYLGRTPAYMISDVDLLKQILVKEFSKFPNRPLAVSLGICRKICCQQNLVLCSCMV